jgi:acetyltransferase
VCQDPEISAVVVNHGPVYDPERHGAREMARAIIDHAAEAQKPLAVSVCASLEEEEFFRETLNKPVFHFPGQAVRGLAYSHFWSNRPDSLGLDATVRPLPEQTITAHLEAAASTGFLPMPDALFLMGALGFPVADWRRVTTADEAALAAVELGFPVCLKLAATSLVHKTEAGGVILNLQTEAEVRAAFGQLARVAAAHLAPGEPWEAVVMSQIPSGEEVILGASRDRGFGPVVAFGAGGVLTEILEDISLRVAPISAAEARRQILETRIGQVLKTGYRGRPPADLEALVQAVATLSHLMHRFPRIQEIDLNPVRVFPGQPGLLTLDARIRVG